MDRATYLKNLQETYPERPSLWEVELAAAEARGEFGAASEPPPPAPTAAIEGDDAP